MTGRLLVFALFISFAIAGVPPAPAVAGDSQYASKLLEPPEGRLQERKRLRHPSLPGSSSGGGGKGYGPEAFRWFWSEVSTARSDAGAGRWGEVLEVIEKARSKGRPVFGSRAAARRILETYGPYLQRESKRLDLALPLLIAVIEVESGGNPGARSPKGAGGLMQLMPGTAARFGVSDAYAPSQNIRGGATYLDWLLRHFGGDAVLALAGYNAGEGAVERHAGVPPYNETRDYVAKVAGAYAAAWALCEKPPRNVRDACEIK
jgi:hypothetical protein